MDKVTDKPDGWVILKIDNFYKVFCTFGSDYWRANSGIKEVKEDEDYYYFIGHSGSCYQCHKDSYGKLSVFGWGVLESFVEKAGENKIEILKNMEEYE